MSLISGEKSEKKDKSIPIPNYFDLNDDGQTPSNTPSNKLKGGLCYDLKNIDFSGKLDNFQSKFDDNELEEEDMFANHKEYCDKAYIGRGNFGTYKENMQLFCCPNLYCNRCFSKINKISNSRWDSKSGHGLILKSKEALQDNLVPDEEFDCYYCNCSTKNINQEYILPEKLELDWECDGHRPKKQEL